MGLGTECPEWVKHVRDGCSVLGMGNCILGMRTVCWQLEWVKYIGNGYCILGMGTVLYIIDGYSNLGMGTVYWEWIQYESG